MHWQDKFQNHILQRGYYYTYNVKNLKKDNNHVEATVRGTEDYTVKINLDDYSMSCTCPYFQKANCKHLAAVLFYLDEKDRETFDVDVELSEDIEDVFNSVSTEDKLDFLLKLLQNDSELSNEFRKEFSNDIDRDYYEGKLSDILFEDDFDYELSDFVRNDMKLLFELKEYALLVELLKRSTETVFERMTFDNYYYGPNFYTFQDLLVELVNTPAREDVFELISWQLSYYTNIYGIESLINFYAENFLNDDELGEKIRTVDKILDKSPVYKKEFVLIKIDAMKKLNKSLDEINEFRMDYIDYDDIKLQIIDEAVDSGDYDLAIRLVKKELNPQNTLLMREKYNSQLKDLYYKIGDTENYKKQLEILLFDEYSFKIEYYRQYKKLFKNWEDKRDEFFDKINDYKCLNQCFKEDKLYDRLVLNLRDVSIIINS